MYRRRDPPSASRNTAPSASFPCSETKMHPFPSLPPLGCLIRENMQCRGNFPVSLCPDLTFVFFIA